MSWKLKASEGESSFMNLSDILPMQHHLPVSDILPMQHHSPVSDILSRQHHPPVSDILPMQHHPPVCPYSCMTDWEMQLIAASLASQYHSADFCPEKIWNCPNPSNTASHHPSDGRFYVISSCSGHCQDLFGQAVLELHFTEGSQMLY